MAHPRATAHLAARAKAILAGMKRATAICGPLRVENGGDDRGLANAIAPLPRTLGISRAPIRL